MEHDMLGQNGTSLGENGTEIRGKMAYLNKRMHIYWERFDEFTSARPVLKELGMHNFNTLRAKFFRGNINIYLHFVTFLHIDTTQVVAILPQIRQEPTYST